VNLQVDLKSRAGGEEEATLSIGEVAARAGLKTSSIRYYESVGILPEPERVSGQRRYLPDVLGRLTVVAVAQEAGFSLAEIRELLDESDGGPPSQRLQALARAKLPEVEALIARAQAMKGWLEGRRLLRVPDPRHLRALPAGRAVSDAAPRAASAPRVPSRRSECPRRDSNPRRAA
jgi:MerR family transcriptional regulator, redox-sensitive transcriptional activator SoxR